MYREIIDNKNIWLITGVAGFIGSHLAEELLKGGQTVVGLDNLSACGKKNLNILDSILTGDERERFKFIEGDIRDKDICINSCKNIDYVLHHAAIGSVPHSFDDPSYVDSINVGGFLNVLNAAAKQNVKRFVYASSSAVYGDYTEQPNKEDQPLKPLSPYAVSKYANELYAQALSNHLNIPCVGMRYFNVYGARQDPSGAYAAVIPKWIDKMKKNGPVEIYGDGLSIRDFCYVKDVVNANIKAALYDSTSPNTVYNIASGNRIKLEDLFHMLQEIMEYDSLPNHKPYRDGDIKVSCADISCAQKHLKIFPSVDIHKNLYNIINGN